MKKINQRTNFNKLQSIISQIRKLSGLMDFSRMSYSGGLLRFYLLAEKSMRPVLLSSLSFSKQEQQYCAEISEENAQLRRILGRLSLYYSRKVILGSQKSQSVKFGENGKPIVDGLNISISHAATLGEMQLCVCTASKDVGAEYGIDVALRDKPISWKSSPEAFISKLRMNKSMGTQNEWDQIRDSKNWLGTGWNLAPLFFSSSALAGAFHFQQGSAGHILLTLRSKSAPHANHS